MDHNILEVVLFILGNHSMMAHNSAAGPSNYMNGAGGSPLSTARPQPNSADVRAAAVHGAAPTTQEDYGSRKPAKLEAIRMPTPKKGKKKRQQTWDNIDDY